MRRGRGRDERSGEVEGSGRASPAAGEENARRQCRGTRPTGEIRLSTEWRELTVLCVLAFYFVVAFVAGWKFLDRLIRKKKRKTDLAGSDSMEK